MSKLAGPVTSKRRKDRWREPRSEYVSGAASYFANAAATNPSDEVHKFTARKGRREVLDGKKTKSTVFPLGRMHRREVHASQPYGLLSSETVLSLARILMIIANYEQHKYDKIHIKKLDLIISKLISKNKILNAEYYQLKNFI